MNSGMDDISGTPQDDRVRDLLGAALHGVEFDRDVVPAVRAGYERAARTRRIQVLGSGLAVMAVAAATLGLAGTGGAKGRPAGPATPASTKTPSPKPQPKAARFAACDQALSRDLGWVHTPVDPGAETAVCDSFVSAVTSAVPGSSLVPFTIDGLTWDDRYDFKLGTGEAQLDVNYGPVSDFTVKDSQRGGAAPIDCAHWSAADSPFHSTCEDIVNGPFKGAVYTDSDRHLVTLTDTSGHYFHVETDVFVGKWYPATKVSGPGTDVPNGPPLWEIGGMGQSWDHPVAAIVGTSQIVDKAIYPPFTKDSFKDLVTSPQFEQFIEALSAYAYGAKS